jgi:putative flippase GtrA
MKEFFDLLKKFDIKGILITPTTNSFLQFFRYLFVGGIATIVDGGILFILTDFAHIYHLISAAIAFIFGLLANFYLSKLLVFKGSKVNLSLSAEFMGCAVVGTIGLIFTELILILFTDFFAIHYMISKIIATVIVFLWNYVARKKLIYK